MTEKVDTIFTDSLRDRLQMEKSALIAKIKSENIKIKEFRSELAKAQEKVSRSETVLREALAQGIKIDLLILELNSPHSRIEGTSYHRLNLESSEDAERIDRWWRNLASVSR